MERVISLALRSSLTTGFAHFCVILICISRMYIYIYGEKLQLFLLVKTSKLAF